MKHAQLPTLPVERATGLPDTSLYGDSRHTTADASALQLESDEAQSLLARRHGTISEDAADVIPPSDALKWQRYYATAMFCVVGALLSADQNLLAPNLTAVADDFGFDAAERDKYLGGFISAAFFLLGAPAALIIGYLSDVTKRTHLLFWVVILGEGPCLLTYFVTSYWWLFLLRSLTGISIGGCLPLIFNLLGDLFEAKHRANVLSGVLIITGAGTAIGQSLAGFIGPKLGWRWPFVLVAAPSMLVSLAMLLTVPEPQRGVTEPALQAEFAANPDFVYSERITKEQSVAVLKVRTNVYVFVQGLPGCLPWGVLLTYLTDFLAQNKGLTVEKATVVTVAWGIGGGIGALCGGYIGQWLYNNISKAAMPFYCGTSVALAPFPMWWLLNTDLTAKPFFLILLPAVVTGMLSSVAGPLNKAMLLNVNEPETRGVALAWQSMTDDLGKGLGPALVAGLIAKLGRQTAFNVAVAGWIPCGTLLALVGVTLSKDEAKMQQRLAQKLEHRRADENESSGFI